MSAPIVLNLNREHVQPLLDPKVETLVPSDEVDKIVVDKQKRDWDFHDDATLQQTIMKIADEISTHHGFDIPRENGVPRPFEPLTSPNLSWSWDLAYFFYALRHRRFLKPIHFYPYGLPDHPVEPELNPLTVYLTHMWFYAKHKGKCHVTDMVYGVEYGANDAVVFGPRDHTRTMHSGWTKIIPDSLADFDERRANFIPESAVISSLRSIGNRNRIQEFWTEMMGMLGSAEELESMGIKFQCDDGIEPHDLERKEKERREYLGLTY